MIDNDEQITGAQLQRALHRSGRGAGDLAQQVGASKSTIYNWIEGKVPDKRVHDVRRVLGAYLADEQEQPNSLASYSTLALLLELIRRNEHDTLGLVKTVSDGLHDGSQPTTVGGTSTAPGERSAQIATGTIPPSRRRRHQAAPPGPTPTE